MDKTESNIDGLNKLPSSLILSILIFACLSFIINIYMYYKNHFNKNEIKYQSIF